MRPSDPQRVARLLGRRIAELRGLRGMTQEQLAEDLGISVQAVRRVELAQTTVTVTRLVRFANALHVRVAALFAQPRTTTVRRGRPRRA